MKKIMNFEDTEFSLRGFHLFSWVSRLMCHLEVSFYPFKRKGNLPLLGCRLPLQLYIFSFFFSFWFGSSSCMKAFLICQRFFFGGFCVVFFYRSWGFSSMLQSSSQSRKGGWQVVVICVGDMVTVLALVTNSVSFPLAVVITAKKIFSGIDNRVYSWS